MQELRPPALARTAPFFMHFISTRGASPPLSFADMIVAGLAPDGGLYVPHEMPRLAPTQAAEDWNATALKVLAPFAGGAVPLDGLARMIGDAAATFDDPRVAPLAPLAPGLHVLELFHGPTLAFKDVALQLLGRLIEWRLKSAEREALIVGATSGDTGSAAIAALRGRDRVKVAILHPKGRTSEVQRRQMTTVRDDNVLNIAIDGTFDDCQSLVKALFADQAFAAHVNLGAINSINFARIAAQIVYYVTAATSLAGEGEVDFAVPTGNFGDIYAGLLARAMGAPVGNLIVAANENDILVRCRETGVYQPRGVIATSSPSMDIQVSSNFERLLFDLSGRDGATIARLMRDLAEKGAFTLPPQMHQGLRNAVLAERVTMAEADAAMEDVWQVNRRHIDPHTAIGLVAARRHKRAGHPMVTLATAHAAKFPGAVERATGARPSMPARLAGLMTMPERYEEMTVALAPLRARLSAFAEGAR